jgi:TPP-dependent pyruvate/acetoin dehydrogenase alpha subunit
VAYEKEFLLSLYRKMVLIRKFEERIKYPFLEGIMPGTIHQYNGQARRPSPWVFVVRSRLAM